MEYRFYDLSGPIESPVAPFDLTGLRTVPLQGRPSKVFVDEMGRPNESNPVFSNFLNRLPNQLAANSLRRLTGHLVRATQEGNWVACAVGGHVIKTGCAPYLIDLMDRGVIRSIHMNGAAAIHDAELALVGKTSEDVGPRLIEGSFGMAQETADVFAVSAQMGRDRQIGLGRALGYHILELGCPYPDTSLLAQCYLRNVPCTVHVAMGTDVVHMHPHVSGEALGGSTMLDFRILTSVVSKLAGGLWMNIGCAVIMPEVFLKAVSIVRNFGHNLDGLVTANMDMLQSYRGRVNVCERPGDEGILLTGHHEIMIPLLHACVGAQLDKDAPVEVVPAQQQRRKQKANVA